LFGNPFFGAPGIRILTRFKKFLKPFKREVSSKKMDLTNKTPEFSGKQEHWYRWAKTFLCRATLRGYRKVIIKKDGDEENWAKMSGKCLMNWHTQR